MGKPWVPSKVGGFFRPNSIERDIQRSMFVNPSAKAAFEPGGYGPDWEEKKGECKDRANWTCQRCGWKPEPWERNKLHAHHKIRKSRMGSNNVTNLICLCEDCHELEHEHMQKRKR